MPKIKVHFTIKDMEFSEAEFGEIGDEFEEAIKENLCPLEVPNFIKFEFVIENVSGLSEFVEKQRDISILDKAISINVNGEFPIISLELAVEIILNDEKSFDDFVEFFDDHDDKNDLISVFMADLHNDEEYFPDFTDEVLVEIIH